MFFDFFGIIALIGNVSFYASFYMMHHLAALMYCSIDAGDMKADAAMGYTDWYLGWTVGLPLWVMFGGAIVAPILVPIILTLVFSGFITFGITWLVLLMIIIVAIIYGIAMQFVPGLVNLYLLTEIEAAFQPALA